MGLEPQTVQELTTTADRPTSCEVCGGLLSPWPANDQPSLMACGTCQHMMQLARTARSTVRSCPYGGFTLGDSLRASLTLRRITSFLPARELNVFEIGFGDGALLLKFHRSGHHASGCDPGASDTLIRKLAQDGLKLHKGDIADTNLPDETYDLVIASHVIEHLHRPADVLRRCFQALRPGGLLYVVTPCATSWGLLLFKEYWWNLEDPTHLRFYSPASLRFVLESVGFTLVRQRALVLDSICVEPASALRRCGAGVSQGGILSRSWGRAFCIAAAPVTLLARCLCPQLASSLEVVAQRPL